MADEAARQQSLVDIAVRLKEVQAETRRLETQINTHDSKVKAATAAVLLTRSSARATLIA